jgi:hypothetical protein
LFKCGCTWLSFTALWRRKKLLRSSQEEEKTSCSGPLDDARVDNILSRRGHDAAETNLQSELNSIKLEVLSPRCLISAVLYHLTDYCCVRPRRCGSQGWVSSQASLVEPTSGCGSKVPFAYDRCFVMQVLKGKEIRIMPSTAVRSRHWLPMPP